MKVLSTRPSFTFPIRGFRRPKTPIMLFISTKKIMMTFVLFFFSVKLIVLARRVKERVYTPGGIGFIAAQDDFYRVTKSQRIE